jgi:methyltransferase family protein
MNLNDALRDIAAFGSLDADALIAFAAEDTFGGRGDFPLSDTMSITQAEGQILYALVRALQPEHCVEVGTWIGVGSTHILAALEANDKGALHSVDVDAQAWVIPDALRERWTFEAKDARYYTWQGVDFVMEDSDHTRELTAQVLQSAIAHGARCVVSHDAHNASVGSEIVGAFRDVVKGDFMTVMVDDVTLGLAIWFRRDA